MTATQGLVQRLPTDFGGLPADHIERIEHPLEPWEKRTDDAGICSKANDRLVTPQVMNPCVSGL